MSVPRYLLPSKKMMFEIPNPESARSIVQNIFERPGDAIIDTCALLAVKSYMIRQVIQLQKSVESDLETAIAFLDEFNTNLPLHKNRILIFPELSKEYERIVNILNIDGGAAVTMLQKRQSEQASNLCSKLETYCRKARRLKQLAKIHCKNAEFNPVAEQFKDLLLYLNQRFEWKDEDSAIKTDEKIIAYASINSILHSPTTIYTMDGGVCTLAREALSFLTAKTLMQSDCIAPQAVDFVRRLKKADIKIRWYNNYNSHPDFLLYVDNLDGIQASAEHIWFPPRLKLNAQYILRMVSERLTDIANSEYFKSNTTVASERLK